MATTVQEIREGTSGAISLERKKYTRNLKVYLEEPTLGSYYAMTATGVPLIGDVHPVDPYARVSRIETRSASDSHDIYDVVVHYDSEMQTTTDDPLYAPAQVRWGFGVGTEVVEYDALTGNQITSSAGELLVPPMEKEFYTLSCSISRNESNVYFNPVYIERIVGCVNTDYCTIAGLSVAPGECLFKNGRAERRTHKTTGLYYWNTSYEFEFRALNAWDLGGFYRDVLDHGTYYLDADGNIQPFKEGGELASRPHNLDGFGGPLGSGLSPVFLTYAVYPGASFGSLGLGFV